MMLHPFYCIAPVHLARPMPCSARRAHAGHEEESTAVLADSLWLLFLIGAFMATFPFVLTVLATLIMMGSKILMFAAGVHAISYLLCPSARRCGRDRCGRSPMGARPMCSAKAKLHAEDARMPEAACTVERDDQEGNTTSDPYRFTVSAPGVKQADLVVRVEPGLLLVQGATKNEVEGRTFKVEKLFTLPHDANIDEATSTHEDGLLHFSVPRRSHSKARSTKTVADANSTHGLGAPVTDANSTHAEASTDARTDESPASGSPEPSAQGLAKVGEGGQGVAKGGSVLTECEADEKNIQRPDENVQELETGERHAPQERPEEEEEAYLAGYQRALEDMRMDASDDQSPSTTGTPSEAQRPEEANHALAVARLPSSETASWDADWDNLLEDLQEMGFDDVHSNRLALTEHSGSIKCAVKALMEARSSTC